MPIILAPINKELRILRVLTDEKTKKHLENLGLTQNGVITVLSSSGGAVVCKVKEGRVALDRTVSTKILVAEAV
ncbi:MAG: ferrous iron transport protein A [Clostridia bacterium]|nr:ferrous iron transport protein A [Clostridia bacterium]